MRILFFFHPLLADFTPKNKRLILTTTQFPNCLHYNFCVKKWSKVCQKLRVFVKKWYKSGQKARIFRHFSTFFYGSTMSRMRFYPHKHRLPPKIRQKIPPNSRFSYSRFATPFIVLRPASLSHNFTFSIFHFTFFSPPPPVTSVS